MFSMEVSELVRELLGKRGITDSKEVEAFLNPDYESHTHSPFLLEGMERAVARVLAAISGGERLAVYADFDCDGIPGGAVLSDFFHKIGYGNFEVYLPHRDREGYGFHKEAVEQLAGRGISLIITVDVGTTAVESVKRAKELGVDVIITDHHEVSPSGGRVLPEALAILNPKMGTYPFRDLCGASVAFKFAQAIIIEGRHREIPSFTAIPAGWEKWLLDLVAIATIADMVPLVAENRALVHFGLKVLRKTPRPGLLALFNRLRVRPADLTEDDVAFLIAPRINAASRMDEPDLALRLLTTQDPNEAEVLAANLDRLNTRRRGIVAGVVRQAKKSVRERFGQHERVVVLGNPDWKPAILGLAANSIMEERGGVVCLWGRDVNGNLKGSCRSDGNVSLAELFANTGEILEEYGGHAHSGGFSVSHENVHTLGDVLARAASELTQTASDTSKHPYDALVSLSEVSPLLFGEVSRLAPFGMKNPKPVFQVEDVIVTSVRRFGRDEAHIEVLLECCRSGARVRAFDFFRSPDGFTYTPASGIAAKVLATIERDSFRGGLVLRLVDIVKSS